MPSGAGNGAAAVNINLPVGVTATDNDVLGEAVRCSTAEVTFQRLDDIGGGTKRLFAINLTGTARNVSGSYNLSLLKRK